MWQTGQRSSVRDLTNSQNGLPAIQKVAGSMQVVRRLVAIPQTVKHSFNLGQSSSGQRSLNLRQTSSGTPPPTATQPAQISFNYRPCTPRQDTSLMKVRELFKEIQNSVPVNNESNITSEAAISLKDSSPREPLNSKKTSDSDLLESGNDTELSDEDFVPKKKKSKLCVNKTQTRKKANCQKSNEERQKIIEALEEKSRTDQTFQRIHELLPQTFEFIVTSLEETGSDWKVILRANINTKEEAEMWVEEYQFVTSCEYRIRDCKKENHCHVWKKIYRCHFNVPQPKTKLTYKRKLERPSKNIDCPANMRITIKQKNMKWSTDDLLQKYPCEITIHHCHNHYVDSKEALRRRRPTKEIVQKFTEMFQNGHHSPSSAVATHKMNLQAELGEDYFMTAADRSKCPDVKWASRLYYKIFKKFYGAADGEEMLKSLEDYITKFNDKEGSTCAAYQTFHDKDIIVAACTPLMKRVHEKLKSAAEVNFVDSSGTMDRHNHRVFLVLCPSIAGGLPLGIIITSSEAEEVLKEGFKLLKTLLPDRKAFCGRGLEGPKIIFTDDSSAERNSLQFAFPGVVLLLCIFHVLQAFWRYVWDSNHQVDKNFRSEIYFAFHQVVYAEDIETFAARFKDLLEMPSVSGNAVLLGHLEDLKKRAKEWALCYRSDLLTRGHTTNNYAEAGMLQLKSTILQRTKAFNLVQLLDFIVVGFTGHLERRLVDVVNDRALNIQRSRYFVEPEKLKPLKSLELHIPNFYLVKNESKGTEYVVNMKEEICSCPVGQCGATCKHQCAVVRDFDVRSSQILNFVDVAFKQELLYIVYGSSVKVPSHWFAKLTDKPTAQEETSNVASSQIDEIIEDSAADPSPSTQAETICSSAVEGLSTDDIDKISSSLHDMVNAWVSKLKDRPEVYGKACEAMIKQNDLMAKHDSELTSAMFMFGKAQGAQALRSSARASLHRAVRFCRRIPINATSVVRRTTYLGGRNVQLTGRPPNALRKRISDHNFCTPSSSRTVGPAWHRAPVKSRAAPHSLDFCVSKGVTLGRTRHRK